jgi:hypothetical protein
MAIIKTLSSSYGCPVTYHRITNISIHYPMKKVIICVASYISKEARASAMDPLDEIDIEVPMDDFSYFLDTNVIQNAYLWLKQNVVGFEDAVDDFEKVIETVPSVDAKV